MPEEVEVSGYLEWLSQLRVNYGEISAEIERRMSDIETRLHADERTLRAMGIPRASLGLSDFQDLPDPEESRLERQRLAAYEAAAGELYGPYGERPTIQEFFLQGPRRNVDMDVNPGMGSVQVPLSFYGMAPSNRPTELQVPLVNAHGRFLGYGTWDSETSTVTVTPQFNARTYHDIRLPRTFLRPSYIQIIFEPISDGFNIVYWYVHKHPELVINVQGR